MNSSHLLYGILFFLVAHILAFFQLNGQFKWEWFKNHDILMSLIGVPISFLCLLGTRYIVSHMEGLLWPSRFIGFGIGICVYAILVGIFFNEGINLKTIISLLLAISLITIQVFWKT